MYSTKQSVIFFGSGISPIRTQSYGNTSQFSKSIQCSSWTRHENHSHVLREIQTDWSRSWWSKGKCWAWANCSHSWKCSQSFWNCSAKFWEKHPTTNCISDGFEVHDHAKILKNSLELFPYKIQSHQTIPMKAEQQRVDFVNQILTMIDNDGFDVSCIWFTDEALHGLRYALEALSAPFSHEKR